jgi:hypothetical protein
MPPARVQPPGMGRRAAILRAASQAVLAHSPTWLVPAGGCAQAVRVLRTARASSAIEPAQAEEAYKYGRNAGQQSALRDSRSLLGRVTLRWHPLCVERRPVRRSRAVQVRVVLQRRGGAVRPRTRPVRAAKPAVLRAGVCGTQPGCLPRGHRRGRQPTRVPAGSATARCCQRSGRGEWCHAGRVAHVLAAQLGPLCHVPRAAVSSRIDEPGRRRHAQFRGPAVRGSGCGLPSRAAVPAAQPPARAAGGAGGVQRPQLHAALRGQQWPRVRRQRRPSRGACLAHDAIPSVVPTQSSCHDASA